MAAVTVLAAASFVFAAPAGAAGLTQLPGKAGCISLRGAGGCTSGRAMSEPWGPVTISPDGKSAYLIADSETEGVDVDALDVFDRDPTTGALTQKPGAEGCFAASGKAGCTPESGLASARSVVVSPDGRNVYVSIPAGIAMYSRDTTTGALTPIGLGGASGPGLERPDGLAFSPDGSELYVTNDVRPTVAALHRDPLTGKLSPLHGPAGCTVAASHGKRCGKLAANTASTYEIVASADGHSVYVVLSNGAVGATTLVSFTRKANGTLRRTGARTGCLHKTGPAGCKAGRGLRVIEDLALSPDGHQLYVTSTYTGYAGSVSIFDRSASGALSQPAGKAGCISAKGNECAVGKALSDAAWIAISPDGTAMYVTSLWGAAVLDRSESGALSVPAGSASCLSDYRHGCTKVRNFEATSGVSVSPDGKNVYGTSFEPGGIAVLAVN